jgi:hypothetical protein
MDVNEVLFLIVNASLVCFIAVYCLLRLTRSKVLVLCAVTAPFVLIPFFEGMVQELFLLYLFLLQYGVAGIVLATVVFELDQIKRARKLRYLTSFMANVAILFSAAYLFVYSARRFIFENQAVQSSMEYAEIFGLVDGQDIALVGKIAGLFNDSGAVLSVIIVILCLLVIGFNKVRAFKEVQRI